MLGGRSRKQRAGPGPYRAVKREAEKRGVSTERLRKARAFAHDKTGYSGGELDALCRAVRDHFDTFEKRRTRFGVAHLFRLLSVRKDKGARAEVQRQLFAHGWSTAELDAEIRRRYGRPRNQGGRRGKARDWTELRVQLGSLCSSWGQWYERITAKVADKTKPIRLPAEVRTAADRAAAAIAALHAAVNGAAPTTAASDGKADAPRGGRGRK